MLQRRKHGGGRLVDLVHVLVVSGVVLLFLSLLFCVAWYGVAVLCVVLLRATVLASLE